MIETARGPVYPELLDGFGITPSLGALFFLMASLAGFAVNLFSAWWLPRWGSKGSLQISLWFQISGALGMGIAAYMGLSYWVVLAFALVFGVSLGGSSVAMNVLVAESCGPQRLRQAMSGLHAMFGLASLLSPIICAQLLTFSRWPVVFIIFAIIPFLVFLYGRRIGELPAMQKGTYRSRLPRQSRWAVAAMIALYVASEVGISTRMVFFLKEIRGFSTEMASAYLSGFFFMLMLGRISSAIWQWPLKNTTILYLSGVSSLVCTVLGLYGPPIFLPLTGLAMSVFFPCAMAYISEIDPEGKDQLIAESMIALGAGLVVIHQSIGWLATAFDIQKALWLVAFSLVMSLGILMCRQKIFKISL